MASPHRRGGPAGFRRQGTWPALCGQSLSGIASAVPWLYLGGILARTRKPAVAWRGQPWGTQAGGGAVAKGWSEPVLPAQIPLRLPLREHRLPTPHHPASHTVPGRLQPPRPGQVTGAPCRLSDPARALWAPWVTIQWLNHAVGGNSFPYADGPPQRVDSPDGDVGESSRKRSWRVAVKPQGSRRRNGLRPAVEKAAPRGDRGGRAGPAGPRPSAQPGPGRRARLPVLGGPGWGAGGAQGGPVFSRVQRPRSRPSGVPLAVGRPQ